MTEPTTTMFWVDDDPTRKTDAKHLERKMKEEARKDKIRLEVRFFTIDEWKAFIEKMPSPRDVVDLFLVDYLLFVKRLNPGGGLSVAGEIRENFPGVPIYMFSVKTIPDIARGFADATLDLKNIQRNPSNIYYDCIDYHKIRSASRTSIPDIIGLLKAPERDTERIVLTLPESFKLALFGSPRTPFSSTDFATWARFTFMKFPGFVYNSLYSATKLGMTEETFLRFSRKFESAAYNGVFARTNPKLWWVSKLKDLVFTAASEKFPEDDSIDLTQLAPKLFRLDESKLSKCAVCGKGYPETVGFSAMTKNMKPVHYRCSVPHPEKTRMTYFEEERLLSERE